MQISDSLGFVNSQQAYHEKQAQRQEQHHPDKAERHREIAAKFAALGETLDQLAKQSPRNGAVNGRPIIPTQLRLGDISDLPPSIREQLSIAEGDQQEMQIVEVVKGLDGIAAVDEILVGLWRRYKAEWKRQPLASKLYRMTRKGLLHAVPKRRGLYSLAPMEADGEPQGG